MVKQFTLSLPPAKEFNVQDFVVAECNIEAYRAISNTELWPNRRLIIVGSSGSGKSHIAAIWAQTNHAMILSADSIQMIHQLSDRPLVLEDIEQIREEEVLFHLLNAWKSPILMTAAKLELALPDLQSRLNACYRVAVKSPSIDLLKVVLVKSFADRQLLVAPGAIAYICRRMKRNFPYIKHLVQQLDLASAREKKCVTIPLVRQTIDSYFD